MSTSAPVPRAATACRCPSRSRCRRCAARRCRRTRSTPRPRAARPDRCLHRAQQRGRRSPIRSNAQGVTGRVVGDPVREVGAGVGHLQHVDQQLGQLVQPWDDAGHLPGQAGGAGPVGQHRVVVLDHRRAGPGGGQHRVVAVEGGAESLRQRHTVVLVAGVEVHLAAAGLLRGEVDLVTQPPQQPHHRLTGLRVHDVVETGDEQGDPHGGVPFGATHVSMAALGRAGRVDSRHWRPVRPRSRGGEWGVSCVRLCATNRRCVLLGPNSPTRSLTTDTYASPVAAVTDCRW
ncbi:hypothetical protein C1Y40_03333 [Mycobacterium talmoniae]|uniref:Uncharacterized protein n=1 Tax=Mycobacterium talmoniae TaxID=1858794 RepID=A0A2S8BIP2_9MYCO|nr:hypothetical protein C1Y40_03333 [Mycobacterium talmoniae]